MITTIPGPGCRNCATTGGKPGAAAAAAGRQAVIVKVAGLAEIAACGVMSTPGLVFD
jgi:hypothetical protein